MTHSLNKKILERRMRGADWRLSQKRRSKNSWSKRKNFKKSTGTRRNSSPRSLVKSYSARQFNPLEISLTQSTAKSLNSGKRSRPRRPLMVHWKIWNSGWRTQSSSTRRVTSKSPSTSSRRKLKPYPQWHEQISSKSSSSRRKISKMKLRMSLLSLLIALTKQKR